MAAPLHSLPTLPPQDAAKEYLPGTKSSPRSPSSTADIKVVFDAMDSTTDAVGEDAPETRVGVDCAAKGAQLQLNFCDDEVETFSDTLSPPAEAGSTRAFRHCDLAALQPYNPHKHCILTTVQCKC